jgi:hypothetical protein
MFQFSLRNLLIAVAFCAFAAAALVNANAWWLAMSWSAMLFSLATAGLLTYHRQGRERAFPVGYLLFGSGYLLLLMYSIQPVSSSNSSVLCLAPLSYQSLLTTKLANGSYRFLPATLTTEYLPNTGPAGSSSGSSNPPGSSGLPPPMSGGMPMGLQGMAGMSGSSMSGGGMPGMPGMAGMMGGAAAVPNPRFIDQTIYAEVGHALWTVVIAAIGGMLSIWLSQFRERPVT